jgi:hypothetical protein
VDLDGIKHPIRSKKAITIRERELAIGLEWWTNCGGLTRALMRVWVAFLSEWPEKNFGSRLASAHALLMFALTPLAPSLSSDHALWPSG